MRPVLLCYQNQTDITRKKTTKQCLKNIDRRILNTILTEDFTEDQVGLIPGTHI